MHHKIGPKSQIFIFDFHFERISDSIILLAQLYHLHRIRPHHNSSAPMNNDIADSVADDRRNVGLHCKSKVDSSVLIHPSVGGTRGYPVWHRIIDLNRAEQGMETDASLISH